MKSLMSDCVEAAVRDIERAHYSGRIIFRVDSSSGNIYSKDAKIQIIVKENRIELLTTSISIGKEKMDLLVSSLAKDADTLDLFRDNLREALGGVSPEVDLVIGDKETRSEAASKASARASMLKALHDTDRVERDNHV